MLLLSAVELIRRFMWAIYRVRHVPISPLQSSESPLNPLLILFLVRYQYVFRVSIRSYFGYICLTLPSNLNLRLSCVTCSFYPISKKSTTVLHNIVLTVSLSVSLSVTVSLSLYLSVSLQVEWEHIQIAARTEARIRKIKHDRYILQLWHFFQ